jgi:molecular chaperone DnaJ
VEDGMTIRVPNAGDAPISGNGGLGDLLVRVNVAASKVFRRQGANLYHEARIPLHTALLGGKVRVPTLDGDVDVRVPGGTQHGEEMVLKNRGVPAVYGGEMGDLFVSFAVQLPRYDLAAEIIGYFITHSLSRLLTNRQRELIQQYADEVEGRMVSSKQAPDPPKQDAPSGAPQASSNDNNGTAYFLHPSPSPDEGGWVSRMWQRMRKLIGN